MADGGGADAKKQRQTRDPEASKKTNEQNARAGNFTDNLRLDIKKEFGGDVIKYRQDNNKGWPHWMRHALKRWGRVQMIEFLKQLIDGEHEKFNEQRQGTKYPKAQDFEKNMALARGKCTMLGVNGE